MAFLSNERKFFKLSLKGNITPGPGEYIPQTTLFNIKQNEAPFNIRSERIPNKKGRETPGPGEYFKNSTDKSFITKGYSRQSFSTNQSSFQINSPLRINGRNENNKNNRDDIGFSTQERRFKTIDRDKNNPGPGTYFSKNYSTLRTLTDSSFKKRKPKGKLFSLFNLEQMMHSTIKDNKIDAIPSKNNSTLGYEQSEGVLKPKMNPENYKYFTGIGKDTVGPGNYDIVLPEQWLKTGTQWSKLKTVRLEPGDKNKQKAKMKKIIDDIEENKNDNKRELSPEELYISEEIKQNFLSSKYNIQRSIYPHIPKIDSFLDNEFKIHKYNPGPGYYFDNVFADEYGTNKEEREKERMNSNKYSKHRNYSEEDDSKRNNKRKTLNTFFKSTYGKTMYDHFKVPMKGRFDYQILNNFSYETPAPGEYFKNDIFKKKFIEKRKNLKTNKNIFSKTDEGFKKAAFSTKAERFFTKTVY